MAAATKCDSVVDLGVMITTIGRRLWNITHDDIIELCEMGVDPGILVKFVEYQLERDADRIKFLSESYHSEDIIQLLSEKEPKKVGIILQESGNRITQLWNCKRWLSSRIRMT